MPKVIWGCKITNGARIPLGREVLEFLGASVGDFVQIYKADDGRLYIAKIVPPPQGREEPGNAS